MQKIISWNVASVRARMETLKMLLEKEQPDFVFLQEIKATEDNFPFFDFRLLGYSAIITGQKGYNGVAILSKEPLKNIIDCLPDFSDQARFIQAETEQGLTLISVYVPNGNPPEKNPFDTTRLTYKKKWMQALNKHLSDLVHQDKKVILGGDFNVIEQDTDVYNPDYFRNSALMEPTIRELFCQILQTSMINMTRQHNPKPHTYSFWDFQGGSWPKNNGILLDYFFVSPILEKTIYAAPIYKEVRGWSNTSDHAPIGLILSKA